MCLRYFLAGGILCALALAGAGCEKRASVEASPDVGPCRDGSEWRQRHGTSCVCCHKEFGVAGSVAHDAGVATVLVTDRNGREVEIAPNPFDNFFRHARMEPPLRAKIVFNNGEVRAMSEAAPHGSCNACHGETERALGDR